MVTVYVLRPICKGQFNGSRAISSMFLFAVLPAVVSMRFDSSEIGNTMSEIVAYGTAVVVIPDATAGGVKAE